MINIKGGFKLKYKIPGVCTSVSVFLLISLLILEQESDIELTNSFVLLAWQKAIRRSGSYYLVYSELNGIPNKFE